MPPRQHVQIESAIVLPLVPHIHNILGVSNLPSDCIGGPVVGLRIYVLPFDLLHKTHALIQYDTVAPGINSVLTLSIISQIVNMYDITF